MQKRKLAKRTWDDQGLFERGRLSVRELPRDVSKKDQVSFSSNVLQNQFVQDAALAENLADECNQIGARNSREMAVASLVVHLKDECRQRGKAQGHLRVVGGDDIREVCV